VLLLPPGAGCKPSHSQRRGTRRRMLRSRSSCAAKLHQNRGCCPITFLVWKRGYAAWQAHFEPVLTRGKPISPVAGRRRTEDKRGSTRNVKAVAGFRTVPLAPTSGQPSTDLPHVQERVFSSGTGIHRARFKTNVAKLSRITGKLSINSSEASSRRPELGCTYHEASGHRCVPKSRKPGRLEEHSVA
jgi:hypothetical protein